MTVYQAVVLEPIQTLDEDDYMDEDTIGIYSTPKLANEGINRYVIQRIREDQSEGDWRTCVRSVELDKDLIYPRRVSLPDMITKEKAIELVKEEMEGLELAITMAKAGLMAKGDDMDKERVLLVDGSMFAPSTRAIGSSEWIRSNASYETYAVYEEALIEAIDNWTDKDHWYLGWGDGCLFLYGPEYEEDNVNG